MRFGLKRVARRRDDALARVRWDRLERLLADHYRAKGYAVEHIGTGGTGAKFDGGVDLKLRRHAEYVLVQVKHWNAYKVPHNDVHQLIGLMVNEGASGCVLACSGEFTKAAIEAAARNDRVHLIDGGELRDLLGPLPLDVVQGQAGSSWAERIATQAGNRLTDVAMERLLPSVGRKVTRGVGASLGIMTAKALFPLVLLGVLLLGWSVLQSATSRVGRMAAPPSRASVTTSIAESTSPPSSDAGRGCHEIIDKRSGTYFDHCSRPPPAVESKAQASEAARKADEAVDVIRDSTPEM